MSAIDEAPPPSARATTSLSFGEVLAGKYRVDGLVGAGGMGLVFSAMHLELEQPVAIKMMREEALRDPDARARFAREAKAAVRLKSEHVARVLDVGALENGAPYLVMELLGGSDLATILEERGPLPIAEAVAYILQACEAVAEAHALGIVHRDLKPRNVFVTTGVDGKPLVKVLDFGISKIVRTPGDTEEMALTKTKDVMGSPSYMAPEQLRAARHADERSDIWSLGIILFELVTGRMPWEAESTNELCAMVFRDPPKSLRALREDARSLEPIVMRCLEKEGSRRYESIEELARALEPFAAGLATGAAERIARVARTSRHPRTSKPSAPVALTERVPAAAGGTSVSWGEAERPSAQISAPPASRSRPTGPAIAIAAFVAIAAIGAGGWAIIRRATAVSSTSPPVLPDDRGAIRPPASATSSEPAPSAAPSVAPAPPPTGVDTAAALATPVGSIPRVPGTSRTTTQRPAPPPAAAPNADPPAATAAKPPNPHDMGSIGRK